MTESGVWIGNEESLDYVTFKIPSSRVPYLPDSSNAKQDHILPTLKAFKINVYGVRGMKAELGRAASAHSLLPREGEGGPPLTSSLFVIITSEGISRT